VGGSIVAPIVDKFCMGCSIFVWEAQLLHQL